MGWVKTNLADGVKMVYGHDAMGRVISTEFSDGSCASNVYDGDRLLRQTSRTGLTTAYGYDALGRAVATVDSMGRTTSYEYDPVHIRNVKSVRNANNENPSIILLDLNMPKMNGIEFLKVMKNDESLKRIPVIVLTTSQEEQDKIESFDLGVAGYMIKPVDYLQFVETMRTIDLYWTLSELPD